MEQIGSPTKAARGYPGPTLPLNGTQAAAHAHSPTAGPTLPVPTAGAGVPIAKVGGSGPPKLGLPIGKVGGGGIGLGLPIAKAGGLPIPSVQGHEPAGGLRNGAVAGPGKMGVGLPIATRQQGMVPTNGMADGTCSQMSNGSCSVNLRYSGPNGSFSVNSLPKWARPSALSSGCASTDTPKSVESSMNSKMLDGHRGCESHASFAWSPEQVLVHTWHQKLSIMYNDYNMVNMVGEGRSGAVFIVQHRHSDKYYACKLLHKADHNPKALRSEIDMLRRMDHPNVVRLVDVVDDVDSLFLLMELCEGGDLFGRIEEHGQLDEDTARIFAEQMLSALAYCHRMRIVHRDVKPENFLLETEDPQCLTLKLADFGIATRIRSLGSSGTGHTASHQRSMGSSMTIPEDVGMEASGTLPYMAPELLYHSWRSLEHDARANAISDPSQFLEDGMGDLTLKLAAGDCWSVGIVIYVMLSGDLPYGWNVDAICSGSPPDFSKDVWKHVSDEAKDLILKFLNPKVEERWTARRALSHPWFQGMARDITSPTIHLGGRQRNSPSGSEDACASVVQLDSLSVALTLLRMLRKWRKLHKLRRICIAAIAKRLEGNHPSEQLAKAAFRLFSSSAAPEVLSCEHMVHAMNDALSSDGAEDSLNVPCCFQALANESQGSVLSEEGRQRQSLQGPTITGFHVRQRVKNVVQNSSLGRFAKISEGTPTSGLSASGVGIDLVSLTELQYLVGSLDANKNGFVDFTLLVAALLPEDVYSDEQRISEVFCLFDSHKHGGISPEDLRRAFNYRDAALKPFVAMVAEFDANRDGMLDLEEFRCMLRGE